MKFNYTVVLLLIAASLSAQKSTIYGRIIDQSSQSPIEFATITAHSVLDSTMLDGTISDEVGSFSIKDLRANSIYIEVKFMGYKTYQSPTISLTKNMDLGTIAISPSSQTLSEIEVTGREITSLYKLEKQVFDAEQFESAQGGNASDVLRNLPAVSINSFGEISVRGATGFQVMINGKPVQSETAIVLQQLTANSIEDIEIISAPSAKYDPDGQAGIINIKTRQSLVDGTFFSANTLTGLPSIEAYDNAENTPRYGADVTVNHRQGKWDLSAGLDYRRYDISGRREGYVNTYLNEVLT